jgi:hypothetical protein
MIMPYVCHAMPVGGERCYSGGHNARACVGTSGFCFELVFLEAVASMVGLQGGLRVLTSGDRRDLYIV